MKLRNKIVLFALLISTISIVSISAINYMVSISQLKRDTNEKITLEAVSVAKDIDVWMRAQKTALGELLEGMIISDIFDEYEEACDFLAYANQRNSGNTYYIGFEDNYFLEGTRFKLPYNASEAQWYIDARNADGFNVTEPYVDSYTNEMVVSISKAFETRDGKKGVMSTDIQITYLVDLISDVRVGDNSYAFLVDQANNVVTHRNR